MPRSNSLGDRRHEKSKAPDGRHVHLAMGYSVPVVFVMYAHMIFLTYRIHAAGPYRSSVRTGAAAYFAAVILATLGLGFDGLITIVVAILINLLAWRFAATTNSVLTKCCCPWLAPLTNTVQCNLALGVPPS